MTKPSAPNVDHPNLSHPLISTDPLSQNRTLRRFPDRMHTRFDGVNSNGSTHIRTLY
ncbi:hypothetical protein M378DRAFT_172866 [Amanita muscaria Koide BX008]|uniref:Uncharacterized protein n=1 Tax=Amanita muscaria (strain Koide BX008) TaxID=946122 RepID=A0A0C2WJC0_AMAMK|nr:hypothetical protein M378DRAFT_172866 [Amanita muscaria Koide BX008]